MRFGLGLGNGLGLRNQLAFGGKPPIPSVNTDIIQWNSISSIPTGTADLQATYIPGQQDKGNFYFVKSKGERITGNGVITSVSVYIKTIVGLNKAFVYVWRFNGSVYDMVAISEITSKLTNVDSIQNITLDSPINVLEGDYIGGFFRATSASFNISKFVPMSGGVTYSTTVPYTNTPETFTTGFISTNFTHVMHYKGQSPLIVGIGDSLMEGFPAHTSMVDISRSAVSPSTSWLYKLHGLDERFVYQNCGIGNEVTTQIAARFNRDVVLKKPVFACINGGVNDIGLSGTKETFLEKWALILNTCRDNNIIPIVWKMMPWTNGTDSQLRVRDDWNTSLVSLFNSYGKSKWIIIDFSEDLGQFRVGGDAGNLWNLKTAYNVDGIHYNSAGNAKIAEVVLREIGKKYRL